MSSYIAAAFHPITDALDDKAYWTDDYYGNHRYGVRFSDGSTFPRHLVKTPDTPKLAAVPSAEPYEDTLPVDRLRQELRRAWDDMHELLQALKDAPEIPPPSVLQTLDQAAKWPDDSNAGKRLQIKHGLKAIPPRSEYEGGAGVWQRIRHGLLPDQPTPDAQPEAARPPLQSSARVVSDVKTASLLASGV